MGSSALEKDIGQLRKESECKPYQSFDSYTSLITLWERILKEYTNTKFKEVRIRNLYLIKESSRTGKSKFSFP